MSENKEYTIIVKKQRIVVTYAVYKAYHTEREYARNIENRARKHELSLERFEEDGIHPVYATTSPSLIDIAIQNEEITKLRAALINLTESEWWLIHALFFERKSERQVAAETGIPRMTLCSRKHKILAKLRKVIEE